MNGPQDPVALPPVPPSGAYAPNPKAPDTVEERLRAALAPNLLLVREIGAGGMARVFLAREPALKRLVAVKVLSGELAATPEGRARFEREAQAVAALSHPNIVAVHTVGELGDGTPYFIMQYVDGRSMAERIDQEGPVPLAEARRALGEVAAALAAAHKQGIVHRDVKPANILFEDATGRCLVSDFGIAAVGQSQAPVNVKLTATGSILGTPQYMSPEQLLAEPVTEKTDIYSLGLLAHEMLCGSAPFKGSSPHELIAAHLRDVPARLSVRRPDVDPELDDVVARCLEKTAAKRPTADEVARRLAPGAGALLEWPAPGLEELHGRMRRIASMYMLGGTLVTLVMVVIVAAGPSLNSALVSPATMLLLVAMIGGLLALGVATVRAIRASRVAGRAVKNGYAWMTILETMADTRGDTGNLIAGSREYAGLKPAQRDAYRSARVRREIFLLLGGLVAPPLFVVIVMLGSSGHAEWAAVWIAMLAPLLGAALSLAVAVREGRAFASHRKRRSTVPPSDVARLAAPWYESFEDVRAGQMIGRGRAAPATAGKWTAVGAAVVVTFMVLLLVPLVIVGTIGPAFWSVAVPKFANTKDKVRLAGLAREYVLPKDTLISPMEAGRAYHTLVGRTPGVTGFPEHPVPATLPPLVPASMPSGLFPTAQFKNAPNIPSPTNIISAARRGVTRAEMAYLERIATAPHWKYFDLLGRSRSIDQLGARFVLPFPKEANAWELPVPRFMPVKELAYASVSRAAYHLARGRRDSAETALRSTISVGLLLVDQGNTLIEQLIGAVVTGIGRAGLIDYYKTIGDPRGPALQKRLDSLVAQIEAVQAEDAAERSPSVDVRDAASLRAITMRQADDRNELRGLRLEMLWILGMTPCTTLREVVFGPDPDVTVAFDKARKRFGRFASDSALIDLLERQPETFGVVNRHRPINRVAQASRAVGMVLRNKRMAGCVSLLFSLGS